MAKRIDNEAVSTPENLVRLLDAVQGQIDDLITLTTELRTWAATLAAKLNADAGVTDTDYDATIAASAVTDAVTISK